jgi:sugar/nucleoside kinase (ribokinase family)
MKPEMTIIGVGNPIVDSIAQIEESFLSQVEGGKGGMVLVDTATITKLTRALANLPTLAPGGSAGNTSFALARMGVPSLYLGKTGNCSLGEFYRQRFAELGGDPARFKIGDLPIGHCLSLVTPDGERTMRTDLGAAMTLSPDEISPEDFRGADHAHIEGYLLFNEALMRKVIESAKAAGCTISLDLASFEVVHAAKAILPGILENYVDLVFANEEEAAALTDLSDYEAMASEMAKYCQIAALKIGSEGSYVASNGSVEKVAPVRAEKLVDTTAAGDLWAAGFLYGWSKGLPLTEAARIGSILGSAVVQVEGSQLTEETWNSILGQIS